MTRPSSPAPAGAGEHGFTVVEALIATAIIVLTAFAALAACRTVTSVLHSSYAAGAGSDGVDDAAARWRTEAATAFAVFVPAADMRGRENAGQELDFYAQDAAGRPVLWRYLYDAAARTLQRWDYAPDGSAGVRDAGSGKIVTGAAYPALHGVTRFTAVALPAGQLASTANIYRGMAGLLSGTPAAYAVRYAAAGLDGAEAAGGNGVVQVTLAAGSRSAVVHLAAGSMPAGFTVTGALTWHAIVYRVDQTHRFGLGLAGKSHVFIRARVDVSYDHWATRKQWCDFALLGEPDGLDAHDPHADYKPNEPVEAAPNLLAACRTRHPLPPARDAAAYPPDDTDSLPAPSAAFTVPPRRIR